MLVTKHTNHTCGWPLLKEHYVTCSHHDSDAIAYAFVPLVSVLQHAAGTGCQPCWMAAGQVTVVSSLVTTALHAMPSVLLVQRMQPTPLGPLVFATPPPMAPGSCQAPPAWNQVRSLRMHATLVLNVAGFEVQLRLKDSCAGYQDCVA